MTALIGIERGSCSPCLSLSSYLVVCRSNLPRMLEFSGRDSEAKGETERDRRREAKTRQDDVYVHQQLS